MKKVLLSLLMSVAMLMVQAGDYRYLTFEETDGGKVSVDVSSLTLTIDGKTLTAGSKSFVLENLNKMYFSTSDETTVTGIETLLSDEMNEVSEIYDLKGRQISGKQIKEGIYIVKTKNGNYKIVKK